MFAVGGDRFYWSKVFLRSFIPVFLGWLDVCLGFRKNLHNHLQDWPEPKKQPDKKSKKRCLSSGNGFLTSSAIPTPFPIQGGFHGPKLQSDSSCHSGHDPFVKLLLLPAGRIHHAESAIYHFFKHSNLLLAETEKPLTIFKMKISSMPGPIAVAFTLGCSLSQQTLRSEWRKNSDSPTFTFSHVILHPVVLGILFFFRIQKKPLTLYQQKVKLSFYILVTDEFQKFGFFWNPNLYCQEPTTRNRQNSPFLRALRSYRQAHRKGPHAAPRLSRDRWSGSKSHRDFIRVTCGRFSHLHRDSTPETCQHGGPGHQL